MATYEEEDSKYRADHLENRPGNVAKFDHDHVVDTLAADYIDPTVVITPEENQRLRKKAYKL